MRFDSFSSDDELVCDVGVGCAGHDQPDNLYLALREFTFDMKIVDGW